jgi:hypothetical protein
MTELFAVMKNGIFGCRFFWSFDLMFRQVAVNGTLFHVQFQMIFLGQQGFAMLDNDKGGAT